MGTYKTTVSGKALCLVEIGKSRRPRVVITHVTIPCTYTSDWQIDGGFYHDEGLYDIDYDNARITYPDEFEIVTIDGEVVEGNGRIAKLIKIIDSRTKED